MLKALFDSIVSNLVTSDVSNANPECRSRAIQKATAVLMIDVALADKVFEASELDRILQLAASHFGLDAGETAELVESARSDAEELVSLHEFTQLLHKHLKDDEKAAIIEMLWRVAYADGRLDKFENSLVLKISDLLYVSRGKVMRFKHDAAQAAGTSA